MHTVKFAAVRTMCTKKYILVEIECKSGLNSRGVKTPYLSFKEKIMDALLSKEGHADSFLRHEITHHNGFS